MKTDYSSSFFYKLSYTRAFSACVVSPICIKSFNVIFSSVRSISLDPSICKIHLLSVPIIGSWARLPLNRVHFWAFFTVLSKTFIWIYLDNENDNVLRTSHWVRQRIYSRPCTFPSKRSNTRRLFSYRMILISVMYSSHSHCLQSLCF